MARADALHPGDPVDYFGQTCTVLQVSKRSQVVVIRHDGPEGNGYISYVFAGHCRKCEAGV